MLVTDGGTLIRVPVDGIRIVGRATQGVIVFNTAEDERVMSVERIFEPEADEDDGGAAAEDGDVDLTADASADGWRARKPGAAARQLPSNTTTPSGASSQCGRFGHQWI